jgi:ribosomal-protein-serine acetyltransferase
MFSQEVADGLRLELPQPHQAAELAELVRANIHRLKPWMPWATDDYSIDMAIGFIDRTARAFSENGRFEALIVTDRRIIGAIGFHNYDTANRSAHVGYWIDKEYEGRGIITKCCVAVIDHLFKVLNLNRVQINCNVENIRSRAIPERLGFKQEGVLREVEWLHDRFGDWAVYAMLRRDWKH